MASVRIAMALAGASLVAGCNLLIGLDAGKTSQGSSASGTGGGSGAGGGGAPQANGTIVPLYVYPAPGNMWDQLVAAKAKHPTVEIVAIVNPGDGPGSALDPAYRTATKSLETGHVAMLGYVYTDYGSRDPTHVRDDIDAYRMWYPSVKGIFFDAMSTKDGDQGYYADLTSYAKNNKHFTRTVGNPGTKTLESYVTTVDALIINAPTGLPSIASITTSWYTGHDPSHFGILASSVPSLDTNFVSKARPIVRYIYITDASSSAWDPLPPYFGGLLDALE